MRQTDRQKRNPHSTNTSTKRSGDQGKWRELAAAHRVEGQSAAECSRVYESRQARARAALVCYTFCVSDLGSRQRGPMGHGGAGILASLQRTDKARRLAGAGVEGRGIAPPIHGGIGTVVAQPPQPGVPGSQPGWDETKAAVAGCKRSNRSRRTKGLPPTAGTWPRLPAVAPWHRGRRRDLLLPSETSRPGEESGSASAALQDLAWTTVDDLLVLHDQGDRTQ